MTSHRQKEIFRRGTQEGFQRRSRNRGRITKRREAERRQRRVGSRADVSSERRRRQHTHHSTDRRKEVSERSTLYSRPRNNRSSTKNPHSEVPHKGVEMCVVLIVGGKQVRAVVDLRSQETRVGTGVYQHFKESMNPYLRKKIIRSIDGLELAQVMTLTLGVQGASSIPVECILEHEMHPNEIMLGMRALVRLGIELTVCNQVASQREFNLTNPMGQQGYKQPAEKLRYARHQEAERLEFLDEEEERQSRRWE